MSKSHQILGIMEGADMSAITAAYRQAVKTHHPDRGGSTEMMQLINAAYAEAKETAGLNSARPVRPVRRASVFSGAHARARTEWQRRQEMADLKHQERGWTGNTEDLRERSVRSRTDLEGAARAGNETREAFGDPESPEALDAARRAEAAALLRQRMQRNTGVETTYEVHAAARQRAREISEIEAGLRQPSSRPGPDTDPGAPLEAESVSIFGRRTSNEIGISQDQRKDLDDALERARRDEAVRRVRAARDGVEARDIRSFSRAERVELDGRTMRIHLDNAGARGLNGVAIPNFVQHGNRIRPGKGTTLVTVDLAGDGGQRRALQECTGLVAGASGIKVELVFPEARERMRAARRGPAEMTV